MVYTSYFAFNYLLSTFDYNHASPPPNDIGIVEPGLGWPFSWILPNWFSYLFTLSWRAKSSFFAFSGVRITRDFTFACFTPGIIRTKSMTNSDDECAIIAKLAYTPSAISGERLMFNFCSSIYFKSKIITNLFSLAGA